MLESWRAYTAQINNTITTHNVTGWITKTDFHGTLQSVPSYQRKMATLGLCLNVSHLFFKKKEEEETLAIVEEEKRKEYLQCSVCAKSIVAQYSQIKFLILK